MSEDIRQKCCCFTGHREDKLHRPEKDVRDELKLAISQAIDDGYTTFITGMAYGVDIWAGEIVLEAKRKHSPIKLVAAVPFEGFDSRWNESWRKRYWQLLRKADAVNYICAGYSNSAYQRRNEWMVDRSSRVIAIYNGDPGGTRNTINYAKTINVPVVLLPG